MEITDIVRVGRDAHQDSRWILGVNSMLAWPYYPASGFGANSSYERGYGDGRSYGPSVPAVVTTSYDRLPNGTVEIRRASKVVSVDDHILGHVDSFVVDDEGYISHLLLEHGHLWGHREIAIPLGDVVDASREVVHLRVRRDAVAELSPIAFQRHPVVTSPSRTYPARSVGITRG